MIISVLIILDILNGRFGNFVYFCKKNVVKSVYVLFFNREVLGKVFLLVRNDN